MTAIELDVATMPVAQPPTRAASLLRSLLRDRLALAGIVLIALLVAVAIFAPWIAPYPDQGRGVTDVTAGNLNS